MTPRTRWLNHFDDRGEDAPARRRSRGVPDSVPSYIWCYQCRHRGYLAKRQAKAARSAHRGRRKGLSVFRCPHEDTVWHVGHRPEALARGSLDRQQLAEFQLEHRARRRTPDPQHVQGRRAA